MTKVLSFILLFLVSGTSLAQSFTIENVNVVDVKVGAIRKGLNVVIENNRITSISRTKKETKSQVVDGSGKYLIPGLWDMHTHNWTAEQFFPLLIANGVTGIRDMFGDMTNIRRWREEIKVGKIVGPVMYASGPILDGPKPVWPGSIAVNSPDQVHRIIDSMKNEVHVDFIKVYSLLPRDVYFKIAEEARLQHLSFQGHKPDNVTTLEAATAGQGSQEHLMGFVEESSDSSSKIQELSRALAEKGQRNSKDRMKLILRTFNEGKLKTLADEFAKSGTWICPTLVVNRNLGLLKDTTLTNDKRLHYMMPQMKARWNPVNDFRFKSLTEEHFELSRKQFALQLKVVNQLQKSGVRLLAGTDFPNPYCFPGFSLHDELQLLVEAGLSSLQALQTATINPALFLNITTEAGSVEEGKAANLVLLEDDPLADIRNTKRIHAVISNGRFLDRQELDSMLHKLWSNN